MSLLLHATSSRLHHRIVKSQQHGLSSHVRVSRTVHTISHAIPAAQPINPTGSSMSEYCDIFDIPSCVNRAAAAPTLPESLRIEDYLELAIDPVVEGASSADEDHHTAGALWEDAGPVRQALHQDAGLNQQLISSGSTVSQLYDQDMWQTHRRTDRYWVHFLGIVSSTVFRRISGACAAFTGLAALVCFYNMRAAISGWVPAAISALPHSLLGAALSLLLVFRTNSSYTRFCEGRALFGSLVTQARNWTRLSNIYFPVALRQPAMRYIELLAFLLKSHVRKGRTRLDPDDPSAYRDDPSTHVHRLLPKEEAELVMAEKNKPYFVVCRMTQLMRKAAPTLPDHVSIRLDAVLSEFLNVIGGCERLISTPIPLSYTRHTSRSLILWLATLPMALHATMGWAFLGVDEIGVEIEEPFAILPLLPLCDAVAMDVTRISALPAL
ncbi:MAG: hypothetical protein WDW38_000880 [Sanguina aurantia]